MISDDVDGDLRRLAGQQDFRHRDAAQHAQRFRASGDVAHLVEILADPHPCDMVDVLFALAVAERPWLNWVPMPTESLCAGANEFGSRRAKGEHIEMQRITVSAAEPASAVTAFHRVIGPVAIDIMAFPSPDIRIPVRPGTYAVWRYDGNRPVPSAPAPSTDAIHTLHSVAEEPWQSPLAGYIDAEPLGELPLDDLLGLLAHLPTPPETPRWQHLARSTPTYWYRLMQPWVCLGILHHAKDEPWPTSTRREVLVDLSFGVEDWVSDSALFALVTAAYREPELRDEVRQLVRARLDAAVVADRLVSIEESLANLMLVTPGCTEGDRAVAKAALAHAGSGGKPPWWRRWLRRR
jgi:hypothetical protein